MGNSVAIGVVMGGGVVEVIYGIRGVNGNEKHYKLKKIQPMLYYIFFYCNVR